MKNIDSSMTELFFFFFCIYGILFGKILKAEMVICGWEIMVQDAELCLKQRLFEIILIKGDPNLTS